MENGKISLEGMSTKIFIFEDTDHLLILDTEGFVQKVKSVNFVNKYKKEV
ncbi:hypothetical protein DFO70_11087 [Cytobacillus firmus]|uniref:Uncharacterized protein n=2 Tax=Cytobacillus TaxID=2675230 RepID=A0A366JR02_CYTFI|nr:hypothetical protein DFO70_11087 [Cytobacillus firmus]TDX40429.1 hypothetical protein DFO72_10998 [Cytobacillus oceanisediminis]